MQDTPGIGLPAPDHPASDDGSPHEPGRSHRTGDVRLEWLDLGQNDLEKTTHRRGEWPTRTREPGVRTLSGVLSADERRDAVGYWRVSRA